MKTLLSLGLALLPLVPAQAQIFRPGAVISGAVAGAIIGNNSGSFGNNGLRGAAWGAGIGLLLGGFDRGPAVVSVGYGERFGGSGFDRRSREFDRVRIVGRYDDRRYDDRPYYSSAPYYSNWPDYEGPGLILGGIAGAIIGNNSGDFGRNGLRGAAWGAGIGTIIGSIAEQNARIAASRAPSVVYQRIPAYQDAPAPAASQAQQVTIINNYYAAPATPMSAANSLFGR